MSSGIIYSNNVLNQAGTPALITFDGFPTPGFIGRILYNLDDLNIYQDTGTSWVQYSNSGGISYPHFLLDNFVQNTNVDNEVIFTYVNPYSVKLYAYRISTYLNILNSSFYDASATIQYYDKNNIQKTVTVSSNNNDSNHGTFTFLPYPNSTVTVYISNGGVFVDGYASLELLTDNPYTIVPFVTPLNIFVQNNGVDDLTNAILTVNGNPFVNLNGVIIPATAGTNGYSINYLTDGSDNILNFTGDQLIDVTGLINSNTTNPVPYTIVNNNTTNVAITLAWADLQPNIADGLELTFNSIPFMNMALVNASVINYSNLACIFNGNNVSGLTFISLVASDSKYGVCSFPVVGSNSLLVQSILGQPVTIGNVLGLSGSPITHTITNNGSIAVTISLTLDSFLITEGLLVQMI